MLHLDAAATERGLSLPALIAALDAAFAAPICVKKQRRCGILAGESLMSDSPAQNIPFGLARGMFGAINGAEFFGSPTICKVSQCSIALPSASIL